MNDMLELFTQKKIKVKEMAQIFNDLMERKRYLAAKTSNLILYDRIKDLSDIVKTHGFYCDMDEVNRFQWYDIAMHHWFISILQDTDHDRKRKWLRGEPCAIITPLNRRPYATPK